MFVPVLNQAVIKKYCECYKEGLKWRISILINKNQTLINVEKLDKDEFNLLCKKRNKCLVNEKNIILLHFFI